MSEPGVTNFESLEIGQNGPILKIQKLFCSGKYLKRKNQKKFLSHLNRKYRKSALPARRTPVSDFAWHSQEGVNYHPPGLVFFLKIITVWHFSQGTNLKKMPGTQVESVQA